MWGTAKLQSPISLEPTFRIVLLLALYATALVFGVGGLFRFAVDAARPRRVRFIHASLSNNPGGTREEREVR
jgi:hypothetical protein